jgi:hypothetical protein
MGKMPILPVNIEKILVFLKNANGIPFPPVIIMIRPLRRKFIPKVSTNEESPKFVISKLFKSPQKEPTIMATINAKNGFTPAFAIMAKAHAEIPIIDGKDKSISPLAITNTIEVDKINNIGSVVNTAIYAL